MYGVIRSPKNPIDSIPDIDQLVEDAGPIPAQTCPLIDSAIAEIKEVQRLATRHVDRLEEDDLRDRMRDIDRELWNTEDTLEKVREANDTLRALGAYWYHGYKDLHKQHVALAHSYVLVEQQKEDLANRTLAEILSDQIRHWLRQIRIVLLPRLGDAG